MTFLSAGLAFIRQNSTSCKIRNSSARIPHPASGTRPDRPCDSHRRLHVVVTSNRLELRLAGGPTFRIPVAAQEDTGAAAIAAPAAPCTQIDSDGRSETAKCSPAILQSGLYLGIALANWAVGRRMEQQPDPREVKRVCRAARPLFRRGIEQQNEALLRRYRDFRRGADAVAAAWQAHPEVAAISLIGSVARDPWKEVPRFRPYRRARVELWHECKDVDLALWLDSLDTLDLLRRTRAQALRTLFDEVSIGIASHQVDVFILEPGTDRYLGRLCDFSSCPKEKPQCRVPGCGIVKLLRQHDEFRWRPESVAEDRAVRLFDRTSGLRRRAADLPFAG